jgi:hypothetical protein
MIFLRFWSLHFHCDKSFRVQFFVVFAFGTGGGGEAWLSFRTLKTENRTFRSMFRIPRNHLILGLLTTRKSLKRVGLLYGSPGFESRPAPLPWFSPGKSRSRKVSKQIFPSAAAGDSRFPAQQQAYQPITKDEYCINTVDRKLEK